MTFLQRSILFISFCILPTAVWAQGSIGGVVRDDTGAVLPGVNVEAASPALIEKVRGAVTDGEGQYRIVDLRPGTYTVTFTLQGFTTVIRAGLELAGSASLPVNVDLKVGGLEETLTVTGASPVVDVTNTRQQAVLARDVLDAIPRSRDAALTAGLLVGVTSTNVQDMGGSGGQVIAQLSAHGSDANDQLWSVDGMKAAGKARRVLVVADQSSQEMTYEVSAISAETATGGVRLNTVPKEGGNRFSGAFLAAFTDGSMTSNNLTQEIQDRGLKSVNTIDKIYDVSPSFGGPIMKDRIWFFSTYRRNGSDGTYANVFYDSDPTKPGPNPNRLWDFSTRLTVQVTPRNKVSFFYDKQFRDQPFRTSSPVQSPEASAGTYYPSMYVAQGRWTSPVTSRLLVEVAGSYYYEMQEFRHSPAYPGPGTYPEFEITTGRYTRAAPASGGLLNPNTINPGAFWNFIGSVSYVTGSHSFKFGASNYYGCDCSTRTDYLPTLRFNNSQPIQVQLTALPAVSRPTLNYDIGLYAQDQWTVKRLTLNVGVRFDALNSKLDEQVAPAGAFVPERRTDAIYDVPNWRDISPRVGAVYDLFGDGKTAFKISLSRYLRQEIAGFPGSLNPLSASTDLRNWSDPNGDRIPQAGELGPSTNLNFGLPAVTTRPSDDYREGWHKRTYNWEFATSVQHTLLPGVALNVGYYHRQFGNLTYTRNTLVTPADFTTFQFTNPIDGEVITSYNLLPSKRGQSNNIIEFAPNDSNVFDGVDISVSGRFGKGGVVNGGVGTGRTSSKTCTVGQTVDPNLLRFCEVSPGFFAQNAYKVIVSYPLPYAIRISGTYQNVPGPVLATPVFPPAPGIRANYTVTSAIAGVTLTNGTIVVPLVRPGESFGDRRRQVDMRLGRTFRAKTMRIDPFVDFYNLLNAAAVTSENITYGPAWRQPTDVLIGRVIQLGLQLNF